VTFQAPPPGFEPDPEPPPGGQPNGQDHAAPPLVVRSMAELQGRPVPPQRFVAGDYVPVGQPTLLSGKGGTGKTTLGCQLGAAYAVGAPFLGMPVERGRTLALLAEENADDAHRMLAGLADYFGRDLAEFESFLYLPHAGEDCALVARTSRGAVVTTPFYDQFQQLIGDTKPTLLFLDNARHVARVNEIDGGEVTAAWTLLHGLMRPTGGTTILAGHTPKNGSAEFAGNAAWENVARCRLYLGPAKADGDAEPVENDPRRVLRRGKSNANGTASLDLVWERGAFRLEHPAVGTFGDHLEREMRRGQARQGFLHALDALTRQRRHTSHSDRAANYAPKVMAEAGLAAGFTRKELAQAMNQLFAEGTIVAQQPLWRGRDRHPVTGLGRADRGEVDRAG
jgi:RecA-family ATPase